MNYLISFFNLVGSLICHQLPDRTIDAGGIPLPLCARDTGIYVGIFVSMLVIIMLGRFDSDMTPVLPVSIAMCLLMIPMLVDGFGSYLGFYRTNNTVRLLTGAAFGLVLPFFLIPAANFKISCKNKKNILRNFGELGASVILTLAFCLALLSGKVFPYPVISLITIASFIFLIGRIAYTIIVRSRPNMKLRLFATAGATLCLLSVLYTFSTLVLKPLKQILIR